MPEEWTFVEARGPLQAGTARTLLEAADRAELPRSVVRAVFNGFEVPVRLLDHLNDPDEAPSAPEEDEEDLIGTAPPEPAPSKPPARSGPRKTTAKTAGSRAR